MMLKTHIGAIYLTPIGGELLPALAIAELDKSDDGRDRIAAVVFTRESVIRQVLTAAAVSELSQLKRGEFISQRTCLDDTKQDGSCQHGRVCFCSWYDEAGQPQDTDHLTCMDCGEGVRGDREREVCTIGKACRTCIALGRRSERDV